MTDLLDWHEEDQSIDPEAEYRMLLNGLRRTEGFGLFFVQCSPFGGDKSSSGCGRIWGTVP
jgi:hypothetical protein